jgi:hypothetical protein
LSLPMPTTSANFRSRQRYYGWQSDTEQLLEDQLAATSNTPTPKPRGRNRARQSRLEARGPPQEKRRHACTTRSYAAVPFSSSRVKEVAYVP